MSEKPLFIPLRGQFFDAFKAGTKTTEYRRRGRQWTAEHCQIGRRVILSRGYSGERLHGTVAGFHYHLLPEHLPGWVECYGHGSGDAACIMIRLDGSPAQAS